MDDIYVSIIVVTFNQEKFIRRALESLIVQKSRYKYEILVGDDASTDDTPNIIKSIVAENPDCNIVPVLREKNIGATNNGLDLVTRARGKYFANCDGDDCWFGTDRLEKQVDFLEAHPEYSAICGRVYLIDEDDNLIAEKNAHRSKFWEFDKEVYTIKDFCDWKMPGQNSSLMSRIAEVNEVNKKMLTAHPIVGDKSSILVLLSMGNIYCANDYWGGYRIHNGPHYMTDYDKKNLRDWDYEYTKALEKYAQEVCHAEVNFSNKLKHIFVSAICAWLKKPDSRNWNVMKKIFARAESKSIYTKLLIKTVVLKLYYWHIKHCDTFIKID